MKSINIRAYTISDLYHVTQIFGASFNNLNPLETVTHLFSTSSSQGLIASVATQTEIADAGYILFRIIVGEADILSLGVHPMFRRQGVGRALVTAVLEGAKFAGTSSVTLEVHEENFPATSLYSGLGFSVVGRRPNYYKVEKGENSAALLMRFPIN